MNSTEQIYTKKPVPNILLQVITGEIDPPSAVGLETDEYERRYKDSILDQTKEYALPEAVINLVQHGGRIPFATLKSYGLYQVKQKSKKTTLLAIMIACYIRHSLAVDELGFECAIPGVVLFFDTEQGESYAARTMRLILRIAGLDTCENLIYCDLRSHAPADRKKIILAGIRCTPNVKIVIIDGIVDLMTDFMDAAEGHLTVTDITTWCSAYNIHIAGVLHQNKNDKNPRAHVGSISSQKCEMEISTEKDPEDRAQSIVTCVDSRGLPFEPFAIRWDKGSLPVIVQDWAPGTKQETKTAKKVDAAKAITSAVFKPLTAVSPEEAIEAIMQITAKSRSTAKRYLEDLAGWGMVKQGPDKKYRLNMDAGEMGQKVQKVSK